MKGAIERLREGLPVVIFPEGTRTKTGRLGVLKDGPALISRRAGVPLVPVYVHRAERCWPQGQPWPNPWGTRLQVRFGRPLVPPAGLSPKEQDAWKTRRLELWLRYQERWFDARFCRRRAGSPSSRHASR
jgi:1-acyl-sn-glycerol-3-phosphate acyltransferase